MNRPPPIRYGDSPWTFRLIGLNIVVHLLASLDSSGFIYNYGYFNVAAIFIGNEWWRLLSSTLMHGGVMHLLFNAVGLLIFGSALEKLVGSRPYLFVYFVGGVGANLLVLIVKLVENEHYYSVGSSGAIMAVIGCSAVLAWQMWNITRNYIWKVFFQRMAVIMLLQFGIDLLIPANSMLTHITGIVCGAVIGIGMLQTKLRRAK